MILFNQLLGLLFSLALFLGGGIAVAAASTGWLAPETVGGAPGVGWLVEALRAAPGFNPAWALPGGAAAVILGVALFAAEVRPRRRDSELMLRQDRMGCVTVSLAGMRRLAEHVVGEMALVEAVAAEVRRTRQGIAFTCRLLVKPEASAPELAAEIRARLGAAVQHHIGQPPARVDVQTQVGALALRGKRVR